MTDELEDDNKQDLTVYDLAEKVAAGQPQTDAAYREIENERLRLVNVIHDLDETTDFWGETPQDSAVELLRLRRELDRLLKDS